MAVINLALCISQLLMNLISPVVIALAGVRAMFLVSAPLAAAAAWKAQSIRLPWEQEQLEAMQQARRQQEQHEGHQLAARDGNMSNVQI